MTTTAFWAYGLIVCYFITERMLRRGRAALTLQPGEGDRHSSPALWTAGLFSLFLVLIAPFLNAAEVGYVESSILGWVGVGLMLAGILLRAWAAKTLGEFYTRTLQILEGHYLVERGPYRLIRHPGYLATSMIDVGAGLAVRNWIVLLIAVVVGVVAKLYRIYAEEALLEAAFGDEYRTYRQKTWKLIPYVY